MILSGLTWLGFQAWIKKAWAWCKKNWKLFVGAAIPIIIMIVTRRSGDISKILDRVRDDYEKEIDVINKSHDQEIRDRALAAERYSDTMMKIEKEYGDKKSELDSKKRKEVEKILNEHADDPDEITRRISELTGFNIHIS